MGTLRDAGRGQKDYKETNLYNRDEERTISPDQTGNHGELSQRTPQQTNPVKRKRGPFWFKRGGKAVK